MSCSKENLFSHVIFRPESEIKVFIDKIHQILQNRDSLPKTEIAEFGLQSFKELNLQEKIISLQTTGWLNNIAYPEVYSTVSRLLWLQGQAANEAAARNQKSVFPRYNYLYFLDLVRLIRNLNSHDFLETSSQNLPCSVDLTQAKDNATCVLRGKPIYFWLHNYPDLIFLLYSAGFKTAINNWNSSDDLIDHLTRFYNDNKKFTRHIPSTLSKFVTDFADVISSDSTYITERLMQSVHYHGTLIKVLKNPNKHCRLCYNNQSGEILFISIGVINNRINCITLQRKLRNGTPIGENLDMKVEPTVECINSLPSLVVFAKDIKAAIQLILSEPDLRNKERPLIYTTKEFSRIKDIFLDPVFVLDKQFKLEPLTWQEICPRYKKTLFSKSLKLNANSEAEAKKCLNDFFPNYKLSEMPNNNNGTLILSLIHDSTLLQSNIPAKPGNYKKRWLCETDANEIDEYSFRNNCINFKHRLIVIKGILGMGKSSLLYSLGEHFIEQGAIVSYFTAKELIRRTQAATQYEQTLSHLLFPQANKFELEIINYFLRSDSNSILSPIKKCVVLFDGLEEVSDADMETCLSSIANIKTKNYNLQIIMACQPAQVNLINSRLEQPVTYSIIGFDKDTQLEYFYEVWRKYTKGDDEKKTKIEGIFDFLSKHDKHFPSLTKTPMTCVLRSILYEDLARNMTTPNKQDLIGFEKTLEQYMELRLKNHLHKYFYPKSSYVSFADDSRWFLQLPKVVLKSICEQHAVKIIFKNENIALPKFYPSEIEELANVNELGLLENDNSFVDKNMSKYFAASLIAKAIICADTQFHGILQLFIIVVLKLGPQGFLDTEIINGINILIEKYDDKLHTLFEQIWKNHSVTNHDISLTLCYLFNSFNYNIFSMFIATLEVTKKTAAVVSLCRKHVDENSIKIIHEGHQKAFLGFVKDGNLLVTKFLVHAFKCDVNLAAAKGETPLHIAVEIQEVNVKHEMISFLKENCANVFALDKKNNTPFEIACTDFNKDILMLLLKKYHTVKLTKNVEKKFKDSLKKLTNVSESDKADIKSLIIHYNKLPISKPCLYRHPSWLDTCAVL